MSDPERYTMKHLILGTAGHVDHGKTALVKALTGIDCDTHKEEKRRGITINLGFAHLTLKSGDTIGIIDVPGHRDFVHTMVSGANGIDIALLAVAADGGVMPQTHEHVRIMELLGIKTGIIALTRIDLTAPDVADLCAGEVADFVAGTFLEQAPVVRVSAVTGVGLDALRAAITAAADAANGRMAGEGFRMYIDRIFSVSGFGTVVTGSALDGALKTGDRAYLLPSERELRVRRLERYGQEVAEVRAGDRASLNLAGLTREEFVRGMMVADRILRTTSMVDVRVSLFESSHKLPLWSQAIFLMGTFEAQARIHLIDRNFLAPGNDGIAQIHLPVPCVPHFGDRFVLRSSSGEMTLGGGEIIDASPLHHRRRPKALVIRLERLASGDQAGFIAEEVRKQHGPVTAAKLAENLNMTAGEIIAALKTLPGDIDSIAVGEHQTLYVPHAVYQEIETRCVRAIEAYHRDNPMVEGGRTVEDLYNQTGLKNGHDDMLFLRHLLDALGKRGILKPVKNTWAHATHTVKASKEFEAQIRSIEEFLQKSGMKIPLPDDFEAAAAKAGMDPGALKQAVRYLINKGRIVSCEGSYIHGDIVVRCRRALMDKLKAVPEGITVAQFRDLVEGNRKICIALLTMFDAEGITERQGDVRVITEKGRTLASNPTISV
jgi:selenocysteine-specific elongation factor